MISQSEKRFQQGLTLSDFSSAFHHIQVYLYRFNSTLKAFEDEPITCIN